MFAVVVTLSTFQIYYSKMRMLKYTFYRLKIVNLNFKQIYFICLPL